MEQEIRELKEEVGVLKNLVFALIKNDKYYFGKHIVLANGANISFSSGTGTKIGATGDKIGFLGATPVIRQADISDPAGGATVDSQARTAINSILDVLEIFGLTS